MFLFPYKFTTLVLPVERIKMKPTQQVSTQQNPDSGHGECSCCGNIEKHTMCLMRQYSKITFSHVNAEKANKPLCSRKHH